MQETVWENQAETSGSSLPVESHRMHVILESGCTECCQPGQPLVPVLRIRQVLGAPSARLVLRVLRECKYFVLYNLGLLGRLLLTFLEIEGSIRYTKFSDV